MQANSQTTFSHISPQQAAQELLKRRAARQSLLTFTSYTKPDFESSWHHEEIAEKLEAVECGEVKRLIIEAPPRHTKSELASRRFPAWYVGRNPHKQIITSTYSGEFAADFGREVRGIVSEPSFKHLFPDVVLREDSKAANRWHTNKRGVYVSVGVGGAITGRGAHLALIDDPFKNRQEADSEVTREAVWKWYSSTLRTRLMPGGAIVLILTRWHEDDLAGRLIAKAEQGGEQWERVTLKAIENEGQADEKALWPEWYPLKDLYAIKSSVDSRDWSALYQQNPVPEDGTFFKREWFKRFHLKDAPETRKYVATDYAVSEGTGDFTEFGVWGVDAGANLYALAWYFDQSTADVWIEELLDLIKDNKPLTSYGEKGVIQKAIEPLLNKRSRERGIYCHHEWIARTKDKAAMAQAFRARASMGMVYIPYGDWGDRLINQLCSFPAGKHDDAVDVCALMGLVLDEITGATQEKPKQEQKPSKWDKAFEDDEDESGYI